MLVIGLTGGIGAGKTTVAQLFIERGITVIDADQIARQLTAPGQPALQQIVKHFGCEVLLDNGALDRSKLRKIIFDDKPSRFWLEKLLHPLIRAEIQRYAHSSSSPYCIAMIPLLLESEPNQLIQRILVVDASEEQQVKRVQQRDQASRTTVESILKTQTSRNKRLAAADDIIINNGSLKELIPQIEKLHHYYLKLSQNMQKNPD
ncbi:MAG: dephospho-CoA kinase [Gammaproteobacteria bacterium RIFCSPHIGHO2_12_FULL_42_13]|nr:MAG: dephospho-CoA kinase [Gammaproteobacteria bacterium RIFCSPHIGHO2_12_FULL_42_13]